LDAAILDLIEALPAASGRLYVIGICGADGSVFREIYLVGQRPFLSLSTKLSEFGFDYSPAHVNDKYSVKFRPAASK
jgi:hypothetical protein